MTPCYVGTLSYSSACIYEKKPRPGGPGFTYGAASQIRTGDLILTNYEFAIAPHSGEYEKSLLLLHKSHIAITGNDVA